MEESIIKTIRVSEKGQIAIPIEIRERLDILQGDELVIVQNDQKLLIEKAPKISKKIKDDFKDILKYSEQSLKDVWDNPDDEIWNSYLKHRESTDSRVCSRTRHTSALGKSS